MRLPERDSDWQLIISSLMLACSIFLVVLAEAKNRQVLEMLKEVRKIEQNIKEVCK
jgi:YbbR domain-containing protein